jgi:hypothetical protein
MVKRFKKSLDLFIEKRLEEVYPILAVDKKYKELNRHHLEIFDQIKELLPEQGKPLLMILDETRNAISAIDEKFYYTQGFIEAFKLAKILYDLYIAAEFATDGKQSL